MNDKAAQITFFEEYPDILTVRQVCKALGIGRKGVYKLLESNRIHCFKIGNAFKIPKSALVAFVQQSCNDSTGGIQQ